MPVAVVAGLAHSLRRPAHPALLVALAGGRRAAIGRGGVLAIGIVERPLGAPDDVGRQRRSGIATYRVERGLVQRERLRRLEEPERVLDLPNQVSGMARGDDKT